MLSGCRTGLALRFRALFVDAGQLPLMLDACSRFRLGNAFRFRTRSMRCLNTCQHLVAFTLYRLDLFRLQRLLLCQRFGQFVLGLNLLCFQCSQRNLFLFFLCCQTRCFVGCGHALTRRDNGARIGL